MRGGNARNSGNRNHRNSRQYNNNNNSNNGGSNNNSSSGNYGQQTQQVPPPHHAAAAAVAIHPASHSQQQQQQHHHHQQTQSQLPLLPTVMAQAPQPPVLSAAQFITPAGYMIPGVPQSVIHNVPIASPFPIDIEHHHQHQQQQQQHPPHPQHQQQHPSNGNSSSSSSGHYDAAPTPFYCTTTGVPMPAQLSDERYAIHCLQPPIASDYVLDPHQIHQHQLLVQQQQPLPSLPPPQQQQQSDQQNRVSSTGTSTSADDHQSDQSLSTSDNNDNSEKTSENSTGNVSFADQLTKPNEDFDSNGAQTNRQYSYSNKQMEYGAVESHQMHHQQQQPPPLPPQTHYLNQHQQTAFVPATAAPPYTQFYHHSLPTAAVAAAAAAHATPHMPNSQPQAIYTPNTHHHHPAMGTPLYITHMMHASVMPHYAFNIGPPITGHPFYANQPPLPPQVYSHLQHHPSPQHPQPHLSTQFHPGYQHIQAHHPHQPFQHQLIAPTARLDPVVDDQQPQSQPQQQEQQEEEQQQQKSEMKNDSTIPDSEALAESSNINADAEDTTEHSMHCEQPKELPQHTFYSASFQQSSNQFRSRASSNTKFHPQSTKDSFAKSGGSNDANSSNSSGNNSFSNHGGTNEQQRNAKKDSGSNVNIINTVNAASDSPHLKSQPHFPSNNSQANSDNTTNIVNKNEQRSQTSILTNSTSNGMLKKAHENNKVTSVNKDDKTYAEKTEKTRTGDQHFKQASSIHQITHQFSSNMKIGARRDAKNVMSSPTSLANETVASKSPKPSASSQSTTHSQTSAETSVVPAQSPSPHTSSETPSTSATQPETAEARKAAQQAAMITAAMADMKAVAAATKKPVEPIPKTEQTWASVASSWNSTTPLSSSSASANASALSASSPAHQSAASTSGLSYSSKSASSKSSFDSHSSSLFKPSSGSSAASSNSRYHQNSHSMNSSDFNAKKSKFEGPLFHRIGEFLDAYEVNRRVIGFQPRGLLNRNNYCYVNSILQSLCACSPFVNLFLSLSEYTTKMTSEKSSIPILNGMTELFREFAILPKEKFGRNKDRLHKKDDVNVGLVFEPTQIYKILNSIDSLNNDGKQQDAEEFFGRLLNGINDEINELIKLVNEEKEKLAAGNNVGHNQKMSSTSSSNLANGSIAAVTSSTTVSVTNTSISTTSSTVTSEDNDNEWTKMRPRNKSSIIRRTNLNITPISCIFGGQLRSKIHRCGEPDTDNIQPFLTLPLNIDTRKMPPVKGNRDKRAGSQQASSSRNISTKKVNTNGLTDEAAELTKLNNSLLSYVEYNQKLEAENFLYKKELQTIQETTSTEVKRIQELYESKVKELQKTIDNDALERAKIEIDFASVHKELEELKDLLKKADLKLQNYNDVCKRNEKLASENEQKRKEIEELNRTVQKLTKTNAAQKINLEAETLSRIEIENKLQTVNETLAFRDQMIQDAFHEFYSRKERVEISEMDASGSGAANSQSEDWQLSLEDLREKFNTDILHNRDNMKNLYINKLDYYESTIRKNTQIISDLNAKSGSLETTNSVLSHRIAELEKNLTDERNCNKANKEMYESEIVSLREELNRQLQVCQNLMEDKMKIDLEIAAYRKVLEAEENRLNISLTSQVVEEADPADEFSYGPPAKRKRTAVDEPEVELSHSFNVSSSAKGPICIVDVCKKGGYVKIQNKNNEELNLNGWQVVRTVGDDEMIYKFGRSSKIDANAITTIWSSNSNQTQELPNTLVMKNQNWLMGDKFLTEIKSNNDEITASFEVTKVVRTRSKLRRRFGASRFGTAEELFHQRGDPSNTDTRNFCNIM